MNVTLRCLYQLTLSCMVVLLTANFASAETLTVVTPLNHTVSPRLSDIRGGSAPVHGPTEIPLHALPLQAHYKGNGAGNQTGTNTGPETSGGLQSYGALQTFNGPLISATAGVVNFDGLNVYQGGYIPSDNNIAVGPNYIVETVNAAYAVYDKNGNKLLGPNGLRSIWAGLGGSCAANNGGDPIVQYDRAADRWIITQLGSLSSPYAQCIAVSQTSNPTGAYYLYSYSFGSNLNDYPKFGIWPTATNSAYLATYNLFANGRNFAGAEICAYDRQAMLAGNPSPIGLCYTGINGASYLPGDLDGATPPLDGTPAYFVDLYSTSGYLGFYQLTPNFAAKTATLSSFAALPVMSFSQAASVPQPGTSRTLDALSDRLMYRLAFRMFNDHESMVVNHSVATGGVAGVRWYELRAPVSTSGSFSVFQQGTYAPDTDNRWMGSMAMDQSGNIALGYSVSSGTTFPSVRYTGRSPGDTPLGTMQTEASLFQGSGSQTGYTRWGDYSSMRIDPSDDCTFWYVNEYLPKTSSYGWYTRIGSFAFDNCGGSSPTPDFGISASPASLTLGQGAMGTSTITVSSLNGFTDQVYLSISGCPDNICSLPASVVPTAKPNLTIQPTTSTVAGSYPIKVTGTDAKDSTNQHSTTVSLTVPADFSLPPSSLSLTVNRNSRASVAIPVTVNGQTSITFNISGLPQKTNGSFSPNPLVLSASGTSTLTVSANRKARRGSYQATITGTNGTYTHPLTLNLTIQ